MPQSYLSVSHFILISTPLKFQYFGLVFECVCYHVGHGLIPSLYVFAVVFILTGSVVFFIEHKIKSALVSNASTLI